ncbi:hypothetical protein [Tessaracoccus flavescens]|uniref:hypothetical protein n=1 Tax=Tessaracoccus flavescens TaxID=399497 RepID=UPI0012600E2E|nr:hypothetical protein [Tessaracoccus flavescens]
MIIWRGWGIVTVAFIAAAGILGIGVPFSLWGESAKWVLIPVALLARRGTRAGDELPRLPGGGR